MQINAPHDKTIVYKGKAGKWRWRRIAQNNRIVGASSEGYVNRNECIENAQRFNCPNIAIEE